MYVYWIRHKDQKDPFTEGYVGVSKNPKKRFNDHLYGKLLVGKAINKYQIHTFEILFEGNEEECLKEEFKYRPSQNIGWNFCSGGGIPPNHKGLKMPNKSKAMKKIMSDPVRKEILRQRMLGNKFTPKPTTELCEKRRLIAIQRMSIKENRDKISKALTGKKRGKYFIKPKDPIIVVCPHCKKEGNKRGMLRWHFDNCKIR